MAIYTVEAIDGHTYTLEAPDGISTDALSNAFYAQNPEAAKPFVKESGVVAGVKKGIEQLVSQGQTAAGVATGDTNEAAKAALARNQAMDKKYADQVSFQKVLDAYKNNGLLSGAGEAISQVPLAIAEQAPNLAATFAGAKLGAKTGSTLGAVGGARGRVLGGIAGGLAGTFAPSYVQSLAGNVERQAQEQETAGQPIDINTGKAAATAIPQAALDVVSDRILLGGKLFGKMIGIPEKVLFKDGLETAEKLAKERFLTTIAKGTATGAAGEIPTEVAQQALERYQAGLSLTSPDALREYGDTAYQVGLLGPLGAAGRFAEKSGAKAEVQQNESEQQAAADQQAAQQAVPAQTQDIATRYQEAEKRKADLKSQIRKVEEGSVTETADRLHNKDVEEQIKAMTPELEQLATEYNQFQKTVPAAPEVAAAPEVTEVTPEESKPARALTVGDSLDNPLGRFTKEELTSRSPKIASYVDAQRKKMGKPGLNDYSIEDIRDAMPGQLPEAEKADLNSLIAAKTGYTGEVIYKPEDVVNIAKQKNINTDAVGFKYFLQRATGDNDLSNMSQPQLHSAFKSLSELPKYEETQNLPEKSSATHYSPEQYKKAVDTIKNLTIDGLLPSAKAQAAAKQASGLKRDSDVQYMLQSAYRNGDLDLDSNGNFIRVNPATQSEFKVEEGFEPAKPTGFNVMRGDKVLFSTQNEAEANAKAKTLGESSAPIIKQVDKSIANEQNMLNASQRSLDIMEANGKFGTPEYDKASAKHSALVEESAKKVESLNKTKGHLQQEVTVKTGKKAANVKAFTTKEKGVSEKSFATREEALQHAIENHTVARLNEIAAETKSPGLKARISKELERRKNPKPFLAAEKPEPVQKPTEKATEEPLVTAQKESIKSQLLPMLKKFGLGDVALQIEAGMKEEGSYGASLIKVALDANNPIRVLRHESIHGLKDLGFFTKGQWAVLENQADKVWIDKYLKGRNINGRPLEAGQQSRYDAYDKLYKGDAQAIREEAIADAFGDFDVNGAPKGLFTTLLNNMRQFFEALRNSFNGAGYMTSDDVFGKIERGELSAGKKAAGKERLSVREMQKGIVAEVAPNPDQDIAKQWDSMSQADKLATTKSVTNKVVKNVLDELGLEGYKVEYSTGTYEGKLNPNILISAPKNASIDELTELSKVIGYVLDQKAMVSYDESNTSSNSQAGFVKVNLPKGMNDADLTRLRNHISKEVAQADADTLRDGSLLYGNFSEFNDRVPTLSDEQYHSKILDAVSSFDYDGKIQVSDPVKFHSELAWPDNRMGYLEGTRYGTSGTDSSTEGANVRRIGRSNLDNISTDAINLRNRWIESAARPEQPAVRSSRGSDEGISLGEKQKNALAFDGIHYGRSKTPVLMGSMSGSGLKGAEKDRLAGSSDGRIKKRAYFYIERPDGLMPMVESGVGNQVHTQSLNNILGPGAEMRRISAASKGDFNKFESGVVDAGYDGYASPDMGMMVILNHDVPTTYQGTVADLKASGRLKNNRIVGERSSLRSESYGLNVLNDIEETPDFGKKPTVDQVAQHFDKEIQDRFGRKLDYNNPEDMARAIKMASDELENQIKSEQSGLDWYDQDIKKAFKETAEVIPSLKKEPKRQIFSVMAGILSPQTNARDNWFIAAKAFEHYEKTGTVLGTNPETGGLWQGGTQSANKKKQMEFLDSMIKDLGEKKTLAWLNGKHPVKEINDYRRKYGKLSSGIDGKATDEKPGFYAFGPKVGPFVSNINGIHDVTVDRWATRTFNRYFGTMADANGSIIDAPTEAQIRAIKELMNGVAKDANIKNYQVQSALWFYEQKLFRKLGTDSPSYGFSQGSGKFLEQRGGRGGSEGRGTAESASPESKLSLRTAPDTPEFKQFFGDSRVVNADGTPKVMYHGTAQDISEFKPRQAGAIFLTENPEYAAEYAETSSANKALERDLSDYSPQQLAKAKKQAIADVKASYGFTKTAANIVKEINSPKQEGEALDFVKLAADKLFPAAGQNVMPVFVSAQKPFDYENPAHVKALGLKGINTEDLANNVARLESDRVQNAIRAAGFDSFYIKQGNQKNIGVYSSTQIKSATGNIGTYDATNPDIRYSLRTNVTEDIKNMPNGAAIFAAINRTTQTRQEVGFVERITEALAPESFSYLHQKVLNRYNRLSDVERLIAKKMGGVERLADSNAHAAALQSDLAAGVAASALGVGDRIGGIPVYKDGYTTVSNENGTIKGAVAIFAPLARYGDPKMYQAYQFWAASKRGKRLLASGKEELFTPQDFAYAKQLEQKYPEFVSVQKDWIKYNDGLVKYAVDTGVISAQNAAEFVKYSDYLPFYRQIEGERTIGPNIFQSISGVKAPKKITGSEAPLADFLETIVRNTQATIQAGMKNVAAKKAADAGVFIGMVEKLDHVSSSPSTITILEKGQKVSYECADRLWVDAVSSLNLPELPFLSIFAKPADILRNLVTKDPGFMLANLMRDSVSAYVTSGAKITPLVSTMKEFGSVLMNSSPEYQKLLSAGVLGGYEFSRDIEASTSEFAKDIRKKTGTKTAFETAASPFTFFWNGLEKGTNASDAATRIAIYKATLKETGNEAEALHRSLEVMNFNRKGSSAIVRIAAAIIPFLNARVQGLDVFFRSGIRPLFDKDATAMEKQIQKAMFIRGATIMAMSTLYAAAIAGDPDYEKQEEEVKDNNWIIPLGKDRAPLKIPIPFEVGTLFKTIPERIYRSFYGMDTNKDSAEAAKRALSNTFGLNPIPQIAAPLIEAQYNYSMFTGREIVSGNMKDIAPEYQVGANTSKVAQEIGMATGMSPIKLEYVYKGYTGTMGMYALDVLDASITSLMPNSGVQRASKRFEQMPVIKRFFADPEARGKITAYYDLKNSVDSVVRTINFLEKNNDPSIADYAQKNAMLYAGKDFINDLNKQMQDLQDQANMIRSADIPADQKRDILLEITKAQNLLVNDIRAIRKVIQP